MSIKISELITNLLELRNEMGDIPVYLSSDPEGNSYGSIDPKWSFGTDEDKKYLLIYPIERFADTEDIQ